MFDMLYQWQFWLGLTLLLCAPKAADYFVGLYREWRDEQIGNEIDKRRRIGTIERLCFGVEHPCEVRGLSLLKRITELESTQQVAIDNAAKNHALTRTIADMAHKATQTTDGALCRLREDVGRLVLHVNNVSKDLEARIEALEKANAQKAEASKPAPKPTTTRRTAR